MIIMKKNENVEIVYVLQNGDTNQYKIGITNNLNKRMAQLQTGCPGELKIIKVFHTDKRYQARGLEMALHHKFETEGKRIRLGGEWFTLNQEDINFFMESEDNVEEFFKKTILSYHHRANAKRVNSAMKTFFNNR